MTMFAVCLAVCGELLGELRGEMDATTNAFNAGQHTLRLMLD